MFMKRNKYLPLGSEKFIIIFFSDAISRYVTMDHKTSHKHLKLISMNHMKAELISFPFMYGLLEQDNIWPRYNYLNIWNLRV